MGTMPCEVFHLSPSFLWHVLVFWWEQMYTSTMRPAWAIVAATTALMSGMVGQATSGRSATSCTNGERIDFAKSCFFT